MVYNRKSAIKILEKAFGFKLPQQKLAVLKYNHKTPTEINSCAGAGKSTLISFDVFLDILTGTKPDHILDITFSKKAQLDMVRQYTTMVHRLVTMGITLNTSLMPRLSTFHALFYHLLKHFPQYRNASVVTSYGHFYIQLSRAIKHSSQTLTEKQQLQAIFQKYGYFINNGFTLNGYQMTDAYFKEIPKTDQHHVDSRNCLVASASEPELANYISVIKKYNQLKSRYNVIDFNDMKVKLLQLITTNRDALRDIKSIMSRYEFCYLDEFQDIDTLQWKLMHIILSKPALHKLTVIGDDDQSIYAFRGSNPKIIINFTKNYPDTKLFHLSTNYRTNGRVLASVKDMIQMNKYRIHKDLLADQNRAGGTFEFLDSKKMTGGLALLRSVLIKYAYLKKLYPNKQPDMAVLCRFNSDRLIATDWLANHNVFIKGNSVLQDNSVYKLYHSIIQSLSTNQKMPLFNHLRNLGFRQYQWHIKKISKVLHYALARQRKNRIQTLYKSLTSKRIYGLDRFMRLALFLDRTYLHISKHMPIRKIDQHISDFVSALNHGNASGGVGFSCADRLTRKYFAYMIKKNFMSKVAVTSILSYLYHELSHCHTCNQWLSDEKNKYNTVQVVSDNAYYRNPITILTIHQSKGLQFKYMFLYNLTNRNMLQEYLNTEFYFSPQCSRKSFLHILMNLGSEDASGMDVTPKGESPADDIHSYTHFQNLMSKVKKIMPVFNKKLQKQHPNKHISFTYSKLLVNLYQNRATLHDFSAHKNKKTHKYPKLQDEFNYLYDYTIDTCSHVEEERRLLYVAITRAKSVAVFNYPAGIASPLLDELNINPHNIFAVGSDNKLHHVSKSKSDDEHDDQHK